MQLDLIYSSSSIRPMQLQLVSSSYIRSTQLELVSSSYIRSTQLDLRSSFSIVRVHLLGFEEMFGVMI